jgi:hypothetical protein
MIIDIKGCSHGNSKTVTPKKEQMREDGHFSTPKKPKLEFDFWNQSTKSEVEEVRVLDTEIISSLRPGTQ